MKVESHNQPPARKSAEQIQRTLDPKEAKEAVEELIRRSREQRKILGSVLNPDISDTDSEKTDPKEQE